MTRFDKATRVWSAADRIFSAEVDPAWASLHGVHGGYVATLAVRAAEALQPERAVRTVAVSFLRPAEVGAAQIVTEVLRSGRSFSTVAARVRQSDRAVADARITMLTPVTSVFWAAPVPDRPAPLAACRPFTHPEIGHFSQAELRLDPTAGPTGDGDDARIAGHIRPREPRPFDAAWLTVAGDFFPASPFRRLPPPAGGVSIDYTVHLHRTLAADPGLWLEGVFASAACTGGIALEHGTLATPDGTMVAETFQTRWMG